MSDGSSILRISGPTADPGLHLKTVAPTTASPDVTATEAEGPSVMPNVAERGLTMPSLHDVPPLQLNFDNRAKGKGSFELDLKLKPAVGPEMGAPAQGVPALALRPVGTYFADPSQQTRYKFLAQERMTTVLERAGFDPAAIGTSESQSVTWARAAIVDLKAALKGAPDELMAQLKFVEMLAQADLGDPTNKSQRLIFFDNILKLEQMLMSYQMTQGDAERGVGIDLLQTMTALVKAGNALNDADRTANALVQREFGPLQTQATLAMLLQQHDLSAILGARSNPAALAAMLEGVGFEVDNGQLQSPWGQPVDLGTLAKDLRRAMSSPNKA